MCLSETAWSACHVHLSEPVVSTCSSGARAYSNPPSSLPLGLSSTESFSVLAQTPLRSARSISNPCQYAAAHVAEASRTPDLHAHRGGASSVAELSPGCYPS